MTPLSLRLAWPRRPAALRARLAALRSVARERAALARLEPHLLHDIGIDAETARREARRPPWDAADRRRS